MKYLLPLICLLLAQGLVANVSKSLDQLRSENYNARGEGRSEILQNLSAASAPGANQSELQSLLVEVAAGSQKDLPLPSRLYLIRMLGLFGNDASVETLVRLLDDGALKVQGAAEQALAEIGSESAVTALVKRMEVLGEGDRRGLILALSHSRSDAAAIAVARQLYASDPVIQSAAALALGKMEVTKATAVLLQFRISAPQDQRLAFETALLDIGLDVDTAKELVQTGSNDSIRVGAFQQLAQLDAATAAEIFRAALNQEATPGRYGFLASAMRVNVPELEAVLIDSIKILSPTDQILAVNAIGDTRATRYEDYLLSLLKTATGDLKIGVIDALGWIGTDKSYEALYAQYLADKENDKILDALARLNAPLADERLTTTLNRASNTTDAIAAVQVMMLRNTPGAVEPITSIAHNSGDKELREACLKALEAIGNMGSIQMMLELILKQDEMTRPAQQSLKRLSLNYGIPEIQWAKAYQPAIRSATSDAQVSDIILIMDGVPCDETLEFMLASYANPELKQAVLRTLPRWTEYNVGLTWIAVASSPHSSDADKKKALQGLERTFSSGSMNGDIRAKAKAAKDTILAAQSDEQKLIVLKAFKEAGFRNWEKSKVRDELKSLRGDPAIKDALAALIN